MNSTIHGVALALLAAAPVRSRARLTPPVWPVPMPLVREGIALHDKADYAGATAKYGAALPGDSTYALAQSELALSLRAASQHEQAIAAARRALALNPDEPQTPGQVFERASFADSSLRSGRHESFWPGGKLLKQEYMTENSGPSSC
ncbi:hypothetical protein [uncultured Hymenobacter sp.]|uniref:hypothetical protein n=1 Tax=uncultured Hymenobacter sp. TaxID=170016 RepID=UPI0035CB653B